MGFISKQDVRQYMLDRTADDNPLLLDLAYTDEDITAAMKAAAREFNSIPPLFVRNFDADSLPDDTNIFFDGIACALLRMQLFQKTRNDIQHQAGNVTAAVDAAHINHIRQLIPMFDERFRRAAGDYLLAINVNNGFGSVG